MKIYSLAVMASAAWAQYGEIDVSVIRMEQKIGILGDVVLTDEQKAEIENQAYLTGTADNANGNTRTLADGWAASMVNSINNYACWCYFGNNHGKGRGPQQNGIDSQCRILHDGYSCILEDAADEGEENCVPWESEYTEPTGLGWWNKIGDNLEEMQAALRRDCLRKNKRASNCAKRTCIVEGYFAINLFQLLTSGEKFNRNLKHSRGRFDPLNECLVVNPSPVTGEKRCCGNYPIRFPYKYLENKRECCAGVTFNAEFLQCCDNGEIKVSCD